MDLARQDMPSSRITEAKWQLIRKELLKEPYTVLQAKPIRSGPPEAYIVSVPLFDNIIKRITEYDELIGSDEFTGLMAENTGLRTLLNEILAKLQQSGKVKIDDETWETVRTSIYARLKIHPNLDDDDSFREIDEIRADNFEGLTTGPMWAEPGNGR